MIELIFVIVVIGILAAVAIPKIWVTRDDAIIVKARTQISSIRASIGNAYSKNIISGNNQCPSLETNASGAGNTLFEGVLTYSISNKPGDIKWTLNSDNPNETNYTITINHSSTYFIYDKNTSNNCKFDCDHNNKLCQKLTE